MISFQKGLLLLQHSLWIFSADRTNQNSSSDRIETVMKKGHTELASLSETLQKFWVGYTENWDYWSIERYSESVLSFPLGWFWRHQNGEQPISCTVFSKWSTGLSYREGARKVLPKGGTPIPQPSQSCDTSYKATSFQVLPQLSVTPPFLAHPCLRLWPLWFTSRPGKGRSVPQPLSAFPAQKESQHVPAAAAVTTNSPTSSPP